MAEAAAQGHQCAPAPEAAPAPYDRGSGSGRGGAGPPPPSHCGAYSLAPEPRSRQPAFKAWIQRLEGPLIVELKPYGDSSAISQPGSPARHRRTSSGAPAALANGGVAATATGAQYTAAVQHRAHATDAGLPAATTRTMATPPPPQTGCFAGLLRLALALQRPPRGAALAAASKTPEAARGHPPCPGSDSAAAALVSARAAGTGTAAATTAAGGTNANFTRASRGLMSSSADIPSIPYHSQGPQQLHSGTTGPWRNGGLGAGSRVSPAARSSSASLQQLHSPISVRTPDGLVAFGPAAVPQTPRSQDYGRFSAPQPPSGSSFFRSKTSVTDASGVAGSAGVYVGGGGTAAIDDYSAGDIWGGHNGSGSGGAAHSPPASGFVRAPRSSCPNVACLGDALTWGPAAHSVAAVGPAAVITPEDALASSYVEGALATGDPSSQRHAGSALAYSGVDAPDSLDMSDFQSVHHLVPFECQSAGSASAAVSGGSGAHRRTLPLATAAAAVQLWSAGMPPAVPLPILMLSGVSIAASADASTASPTAVGSPCSPAQRHMAASSLMLPVHQHSGRVARSSKAPSLPAVPDSPDRVTLAAAAAADAAAAGAAATEVSDRGALENGTPSGSNTEAVLPPNPFRSYYSSGTYSTHSAHRVHSSYSQAGGYSLSDPAAAEPWVEEPVTPQLLANARGPMSLVGTPRASPTGDSVGQERLLTAVAAASAASNEEEAAATMAAPTLAAAEAAAPWLALQQRNSGGQLQQRTSGGHLQSQLSGERLLHRQHSSMQRSSAGSSPITRRPSHTVLLHTSGSGGNLISARMPAASQLAGGAANEDSTSSLAAENSGDRARSLSYGGGSLAIPSPHPLGISRRSRANSAVQIASGGGAGAADSDGSVGGCGSAPAAAAAGPARKAGLSRGSTYAMLMDADNAPPATQQQQQQQQQTPGSIAIQRGTSGTLSRASPAVGVSSSPSGVFPSAAAVLAFLDASRTSGGQAGTAMPARIQRPLASRTAPGAVGSAPGSPYVSSTAAMLATAYASNGSMATKSVTSTGSLASGSAAALLATASAGSACTEATVAAAVLAWMMPGTAGLAADASSSSPQSVLGACPSPLTPLAASPTGVAVLPQHAPAPALIAGHLRPDAAQLVAAMHQAPTPLPEGLVLDAASAALLAARAPVTTPGVLRQATVPATWQGMPVAVRVFLTRGPEGLAHVLQEALLCSGMRHPNVLQCYTWHTHCLLQPEQHQNQNNNNQQQHQPFQAWSNGIGVVPVPALCTFTALAPMLKVYNAADQLTVLVLEEAALAVPRCSSHPQHQLQQAGSRAAMENAASTTLEVALGAGLLRPTSSGAVVAMARALSIARDAASGLAHIHRRGATHGALGWDSVLLVAGPPVGQRSGLSAPRISAKIGVTGGSRLLLGPSFVQQRRTSAVLAVGGVDAGPSSDGAAAVRQDMAAFGRLLSGVLHAATGGIVARGASRQAHPLASTYEQSLGALAEITAAGNDLARACIASDPRDQRTCSMQHVCTALDHLTAALAAMPPTPATAPAPTAAGPLSSSAAAGVRAPQVPQDAATDILVAVAPASTSHSKDGLVGTILAGRPEPALTLPAVYDVTAPVAPPTATAADTWQVAGSPPCLSPGHQLLKREPMTMVQAPSSLPPPPPAQQQQQQQMQVQRPHLVPNHRASCELQPATPPHRTSQPGSALHYS